MTSTPGLDATGSETTSGKAPARHAAAGISTPATVWPGAPHNAAELADIGRQARKAVPRSSHSEFTPASTRDPLAILAAQATTRVPDLVPVRHARMAVSPFTFYRGAAAVMAADLATTPTTDLHVQLCGDAHLLNFGGYGTPERHLAFDVNDFDETLPGPFEWDVKRLAASVAVAANDRGFNSTVRHSAAAAAASAYQSSIATLATMPTMDRWYMQINVDQILPLLPEQDRQRAERQVNKAFKRTSMQALRRLTAVVDGQLRIVDDPPLIIHFDNDIVDQQLATLFDGYRPTLSSDRRDLLSRFHVVDVAGKVVGVGSVGTRCYIVLMTAYSDDTPLFLQVKQAQASVLEPFVGPAAHATHGERVVAGQRLMQASSDIFLGWAEAGGHEYYLRQLRDLKGSVDIDTIDPDALHTYARTCGSALARAHARSGNVEAIAAYLGTKGTFADAIAEFSVNYAELNVADHAAMVDAIAEGRIESAPPA
jgi:uncharacterized protein (DUF2252 family)